MSDKITVISTSCLSEPPVNHGPVDVLWTSSEINHESCLPVIGSYQMSSIISTLENDPLTPSEKPADDKNIDDTLNTFKSIPINIINTDSESVDEVKKRIKNKNENLVVLDKNKLFSEMMYFGCNLCPFICTKDNKISDHIQNVHNNKDNNQKTQLKCPGCPNIFYHKLSLRSHLIHDHEVGRNDINKIVNSIVYVSVLSQNNNLSDGQTNEQQNQPAVENETTDSQQDFLQENIIEDEPINEENNMEIDFIDAAENAEKIEDMEHPLIVNEDYLMKEETETPENITKNVESKIQKCCVSTCAVRINDVNNMSYHIKCHFGKIFRCLQCNENAFTWKTLQTHLWKMHNIDMELFSCDQCNYKTNSLAKLNNMHKLIHGQEKPFLCDICGKGFKNPKQLRNHKNIHKIRSKDMLHYCDICKRGFVDRRLLKGHIDAVHEKIKPFSCSFCGYKAASKAVLQLHTRIHTGQKPFTCDSCDYSTADHNSLRRHKLRHSGEKKYKCIHCDYACIQSSTYKAHLKTKHPGMETDLMFSCNFCQFRSVSKDKYNVHLASHKKTVENIPENTEGLEERVVELVTMKNKKQTEEKQTQQLQILQQTPVALIAKVGEVSQNCFIVTTDNTVLPTSTAGAQNNIQQFYNNGSVLLEIIHQKNDK